MIIRFTGERKDEKKTAEATLGALLIQPFPGRKTLGISNLVDPNYGFD